MNAIAILDLIAVPVGILTMAAVGYASAHAATYFREKTHNERLARIADAAGRLAGDISRGLQALPPGANAKAAEQAALNVATVDLNTEFSGTLANLGNPGAGILRRMVAGELGKLTAPAQAAVQVGPALAAPQTAAPAA